MATLLGSLLLSACSVFGIRNGTEEPPHSVMERLGDVEIRRYAPRLAVETTVSGDATAARGEGFRRLAGYIFGDNQGRTRIEMTASVAQSGTRSGTRIAMTAPVAQAPGEAGWVIRFFLPAGLADPPKPNDARVRIVPVPAETVRRAALQRRGHRCRHHGPPGGPARRAHRHPLAPGGRGRHPVLRPALDPPAATPQRSGGAGVGRA